MIKSFLSRLTRGDLLLTGVFSCLFALSAPAQSSGSTSQVTPTSTAGSGPAKSIGPAPVNTKQGKILDGALSSRTRQTLQEAMDSARASDASHPAPPSK